MMAHYNTTDPGTGNLPLQKEETKTFAPMPTSRAQNITGSIFVDQAGFLNIQQSFDEQNWDVSQSIAIKANEGKGFDIDIIAPNVRIVYENGPIKQKVMRLFTRTMVQGV